MNYLRLGKRFNYFCYLCCLGTANKNGFLGACLENIEMEDLCSSLVDFVVV